MAQYLNAKATFKCSECQSTVIIATDPLAKAKFNGETVLTGNTMLSLRTPGPLCKYLTQQAGGTTPIPCAFPGLIGSNLSGTDRKCTSGNSFLMTDEARGRCPLAPVSVISVSSPSNRPKFFKQFGGHTFSGVAAGGEAATAVAPAVEREQVSPTTSESPQNNAKAQLAATEAAKQPPTVASDEKPVFRCDTCEEAATCEFYKNLCLRQQVTKNSKSLRENYEARIGGKKEINPTCSPILSKDHLAHKAYTEANEAKNYFSGKNQDVLAVWNYPAHHIICGELFLTIPGLNDLSRAYEYDMNCADNCIMLIGKERKGERFSDLETDEKHSYAFERMAWGRMQWHSGGHQYNLDKFQAAIARRMVLHKYASKEEGCAEQPDFSALGIKCYLEHLKEKVAKVVQKYQRYQGCPKKDFENKKKLFHGAMNKLADEIRNELAQFYQKPHRSHPWFVSKEAWIYAFMLPHCMHIVSMLPRPGGLLLERFNVTRYAETLNKDVDPQKVDLFSIKLLSNANGPASMFWRRTEDGSAVSKRFCADAAFFVLGEGMPNNCAGFQIPEEYVFRVCLTEAESALEELQQKQSSLLGRAQAALEEKGVPLMPLQL